MVKRVYTVIGGSNGARLISVGKILPKDWQSFTIDKVVVKDEVNTIQITLQKVKLPT